jgi:preprotein translocase subunit SecB
VEIKRSELQQEMFVLLETKISLVFPEENQTNDIDDLDIDYHIFTNSEEDHWVRIIFEIKATHHMMKRPGLNIELQASCDFRIAESIEVGSDLFNKLISNAATAITYNNIRAYLQNVTSYYPAEPYILPAIDMQDLCKKNAEKPGLNKPPDHETEVPTPKKTKKKSQKKT